MMYAQKLAEALGLVPRIGGVYDHGGASNISMISYAAMAIEAGQCDIAVVALADNPATGTRQAYEKSYGDDGSGLFGWCCFCVRRCDLGRKRPTSRRPSSPNHHPNQGH